MKRLFPPATACGPTLASTRSLLHTSYKLHTRMPKTGQAAVVGGRRVSRRGRKIERDAKHVRRRNPSAMALRGGRERVGARPRWLPLTPACGVAQQDAEPEGYEDELSEWAHYLHTFADDAEESSDEPEDEPVTPVASPKGSPKREKFNKHTFKKFSLDGSAGMKGVRRAGESWRPHAYCARLTQCGVRSAQASSSSRRPAPACPAGCSAPSAFARGRPALRSPRAPVGEAGLGARRLANRLARRTSEKARWRPRAPRKAGVRPSGPEYTGICIHMMVHLLGVRSMICDAPHRVRSGFTTHGRSLDAATHLSLRRPADSVSAYAP